jgi:hypothetical protein
MLVATENAAPGPRDLRSCTRARAAADVGTGAPHEPRCHTGQTEYTPQDTPGKGDDMAKKTKLEKAAETTLAKAEAAISDAKRAAKKVDKRARKKVDDLGAELTKVRRKSEKDAKAAKAALVKAAPPKKQTGKGTKASTAKKPVKTPAKASVKTAAPAKPAKPAAKAPAAPPARAATGRRAPSTPASATASPSPHRELSYLTVAMLRGRARAAGVHGYSTLTKAQLVAALAAPTGD